MRARGVGAKPPGVRRGHLGRGGRRRRARVGGEVGDGEIYFMPDRADQRQLGCENRARHRLGVERMQVFKRAAAARQNQQVGFAPPVGEGEHFNDAGRRFRALHRGRIDHHTRERPAPPQGDADIVQRRAGGRCDHADARRRGRQIPFVARVKQSLFIQFALQQFKFPPQRAFAGVFQIGDHQLQIAARLVEGNARAHQREHAVRRPARQAPLPPREQRAANHRIAFFQREIKMPGRRRRERGNFAAHPDVGVAGFQRFAQLAGQLADAVDFPGKRGAVGRFDRHEGGFRRDGERGGRRAALGSVYLTAPGGNA